MNLSIEELDLSDKRELLITAVIDELTSPLPKKIHRLGLHSVFNGEQLRAALYPYIGTLRYYYSDPENYIYLEDEDIIIPKQLASSIPKNRKQKAPKDLCFAPVSGSFLPLPSHPNELYYDEKRYRMEYRSRRQYVRVVIEDIPLGWLECYLADLIEELAETE
ncbi:MAG: hypothetical protein J6N76_00535 [Lachnospiraceae bacterium]|nr:hypothetical protein [Lachnospiraceae bacterium]